MKQKFLCAFMAIAMSVSPSICQAERPRPTNPAVALTPGQTYYLYNVEADLFLSHVAGSSSYTGISSAPRPVEVNALENSAYTLWLTDGGDKGAIYSDNKTYAYTTGQKSARASNKTYWWAIASTGSKKYTIQRSSLNTNYYNANEYLGWVGETSVYVYANRPADGNIHWQFIPANVNGDRFVASLLLYHALEKADAYADRGWNFSYYENLYANRQTAAPEEMTNAAKALEHGLPMSQGYIAPYWNEYPILWATNDGSFGQGYDYTWDYYNYSSPGYFYTKFGASTGSRTLSATVSIDEPSTFVYSTSGTNNMNSKIQVYVDDKLVRTLTGPQINTYTSASICARFFEVLQPGTHTIKWVASTTNSDAVYFYIKSTGVVKSPLITVSLLEPGSLGTEVLYNTDHIKNVRRLKVSGKMNDDDWAKVKMMSGLLDLDLSEAEFTEVPEGQFRVGEGNDTVMQFLHRLVLPEGVTKINKQAFFYSFIDTLALPSTLKNIRQDAFDCSHIQEINMPDDCTEIYGTETGSEASYAVFNGMKWLRKLKCAKNWTIIPKYTFNNCTFLEDVTLPEKLEAIGNCAFSSDKYLKISNFPEGLKRINQHAFDGCSSAEFGPFPESLQTIDIYAFVGCNKIVDLVIPPNVSSIGVYAFADCTNMKTAELGVGQYAIANNLFSNCNQLKTLRLNSPTVVTVTDNSGYYPVASDRLKEVDLIVPSFLVNAYKLHKYWYNFKSITGFSTAEIQDWIINNPLVMNHDRFEGNPNITIAGSSRLPSLKFNGTNAQNINNLVLESYHENYNNKPGQIFSNGSNIHVNGNVEVQLYTAAKRWYFFSLPFDMKISDITHSASDVQYKIGYYDGANRAANGASGSWKAYNKESDVIPAGTGFIMQTNKDTYTYFHAMNNATKQNLVSYNEFVKTLAVNASEQKANTGWNLIGNPYQCFYNSHCLNFTAPITVWDAYNRKYVAYSITDDDYAIRPNEGFFVQCPNATNNTIGFPLQGRQLTDVVDSQNAAHAMTPDQKERNLINIVLTASDGSNDETRVVLNEKASLDYEMTCDASKFMSMDNTVPQLFTLDAEGTQYAINERPMSDGIVKLGLYVAQGGTYTICIGRCDMEKVMLVDNKTGETIDISYGTYTFSTDAGIFTNRFELVFDAEGDATGIETLSYSYIKGEEIYNIAGQRVNANKMHGIYIVNGKKVIK